MTAEFQSWEKQENLDKKISFIVAVEQKDDFENREYLVPSSVVYILVGKIYF